MQPEPEGPVLVPFSTPAHQALLAERRGALRAELGAILRDRTDRFVWEVGCGHGHFLTAYAQAHPEAVCIGIDIASDRIERATRKRDRARLPNLHFLQAEARLFLETLPIGVGLRDVFILFPDPWPKLRHRKHRILRADFLDAVAGRAARDCRLCFRTDYAPYFEDAARVVDRHDRWQICDEPWPFEYQTVFQRRAPAYQSLLARVR